VLELEDLAREEVVTTEGRVFIELEAFIEALDNLGVEVVLFRPIVEEETTENMLLVLCSLVVLVLVATSVVVEVSATAKAGVGAGVGAGGRISVENPAAISIETIAGKIVASLAGIPRR